MNGRERSNYFLFTHYVFTIAHNGKQVRSLPITLPVFPLFTDALLFALKIVEANWEHDPDSRLDITDATTDTPVVVRIPLILDIVLSWIQTDEGVICAVSLHLEVDQDRSAQPRPCTGVSSLS